MGMRYRKRSAFEKPEKEAPFCCGECPHFTATKSWIGFHGETNWTGDCKANNCRDVRYSFEQVLDNCKFDSPCYWWYMNRIWNRVSSDKRKHFREARRHRILFWRVCESMDSGWRKALVNHMHRPGGGGLIDFDLWPDLLPEYTKVCQEEGMEDEE